MTGSALVTSPDGHPTDAAVPGLSAACWTIPPGGAEGVEGQIRQGVGQGARDALDGTAYDEWVPPVILLHWIRRDHLEDMTFIDEHNTESLRGQAGQVDLSRMQGKKCKGLKDNQLHRKHNWTFIIHIQQIC